MKLGMFSRFGYRMLFAERIRAIKAAGFDSTTVWWSEEEEHFRNGDRGLIPTIIRDEGLFFENIHVPFEQANDLWSSDPTVRTGIVERHLGWLDDCAEFGIPMMVIHLTKGRRHEPPDPVGLESLSVIVQAAEERGVTVAVENTRNFGYLRLVMSEFQSPYLRFCYDSSHDWLHCDVKTELLREFGSRLSAVHISDNDGSIDRHWLPGQGIVDWETVTSAFPSDYRGVLSLEVFSKRRHGRAGAEEFIASAYGKAVWLRGMVEKRRG